MSDAAAGVLHEILDELRAVRALLERAVSADVGDPASLDQLRARSEDLARRSEAARRGR